jgi:hypothetical protein
LHSAQDVNATGIQKHIAQDHILVLNAKANTTQPCVQRIQILQQNAPYAEETTRPITKVATYKQNYKKQQAKQQFNHNKMSLNHITRILISTIIINSFFNHNQPPVPTPVKQHAPHSQTLSQKLQSPKISEQLSTFLNELKAMFNQLIKQNKWYYT